MASLLEVVIAFVAVMLVLALAAQSLQEVIKIMFAVKSQTAVRALRGLVLEAAKASKLDPAETVITFSDAIKFVAWSGAPPHSGEMAPLYGGLDTPGPYLALMKWYPGYMSAPHSYASDRLSLVLSGAWWVNSGADFDPNQTVPVPAGGFVRRIAHTPHYDGVKRDAKEPAVIALFGIAPVELTLVDPSKPGWRQV